MIIFSRFPKIILLSILISAFILPAFEIFAEECTTREECEALLKKYEEQIAQYEEDISKTEQEKKTLQNQIYILKSTISKLDLQIYQSNVMIKDLGYQITDTESSIEQTSFKIVGSRENLAKILQQIYEEDQKSLIEIFLSEKELSDFFDNLMQLEALNDKSQELLKDIKNLKVSLEGQKESLNEERGDLQRMAAIQILQKEEQARTKREREYLLGLTEAEYQKYLREKAGVEKRAAEIRARLFELIGVPEAPSFGEALELAELIQGQTGIRPAFLLAIITQESHLGRNVGQCYLPQDPAENKKRRIMHPTRDVPPFLNITQDLGRDPYNTLISCPMAYGFGGAMGPAQFIPSTWMNRRPILESYVEGPDPWVVHHAFLASALYLRDLGAAQNEWRAAMRYFSGARWAKSEELYGNLVAARTNCLQTFINDGTMTERCERLVFIPK